MEKDQKGFHLTMNSKWQYMRMIIWTVMFEMELYAFYFEDFQ